MSERPLVTFAVFAFNQARYVREAVEAAFAQTYEPLQIILSDDCSKDDTFGIMEAMAREYSGPHRVELNRNPQNLNIGRHVNRVMDLAEGELAVVAAGDDISLPHRTERMAEVWLADRERVTSLHSSLYLMTPTGEPAGELPGVRPADLGDIAHVARTGHAVRGSSHAFTRKLFDRFGPLLASVVQEDIALSLRSALIGRVAYIDEPLVRWRVDTSTWKNESATDSRSEAVRKMARRSTRLGVVNAIQALADVERADRMDLLPLVLMRLREAELLSRLSEGELPRLTELMASVADGTNLDLLVRTALKGRGGPMLDLMTKAKATLKGVMAGKRDDSRKS